jgi:hypothetical protein
MRITKISEDVHHPLDLDFPISDARISGSRPKPIFDLGGPGILDLDTTDGAPIAPW